MNLPAASKNTVDAPLRVVAQDLHADIKKRIGAFVPQYHRTLPLIKDMYAKGVTHPRPGMRKLAMPLNELKRYMDLRDERARLQHLLQVLVPLERKLRAGLQQKETFEPDNDRNKAILAMLVQAKRGSSQVVQELAKELLESYGCLFYNGLLTTIYAAVPVSAAIRYQQAESLYSKLRHKEDLTPEEHQTLRLVFQAYLK